LFLLQAAMTLSPTAASTGGSVTATATGLATADTTGAPLSYSIVWNAGLTANGITTGVVVGTLVPLSNGAATASFTVPPNASPGSYTINIVQSGSLGTAPGSTNGEQTGTYLLVAPPSLSVGGGGTGVGQGTLTASGSATEASVSGTPTISQSFTNTQTSGSLSVYMWVNVMNAQGQTVGVFLGSATIAAGTSGTIGAALFNLPSGTYTAQVFCTTTSGVVVSTTSTTSSFSV